MKKSIFVLLATLLLGATGHAQQSDADFEASMKSFDQTQKGIRNSVVGCMNGTQSARSYILARLKQLRLIQKTNGHLSRDQRAEVESLMEITNRLY